MEARRTNAFNRIAEAWVAFKERFSREIIGLLFFAGMGLLGFYTIFASGTDLFGPARYLPVQLSTAEGLRAGARVNMHGVEIGAVSSLHYVRLDAEGRPLPWEHSPKEDAGQTVIALLNLKRLPPLYPNYRVVTRYQSILSQKAVELLPGNAALPADADPLTARPVEFFQEHGPPEELLAPINVLVLDHREALRYRQTGEFPERARRRSLAAASNYDDPITLIASVIAENRPGLRGVTRNLADITDKLNRPDNRNLALIVNNPVLMQETNGLLRDVIILTQEAGDASEDLRESAALINFFDVVLAFSNLAL